MDVKEILKNGLIDLKSASIDLIVDTWWIISLIIFLPFLYLVVDVNDINLLKSFMGICKPMLIVLMAMFAFKAILRVKGIYVEITISKFWIYLFSSLFVGLAITIGYMFFIVPGLIILALSVFVPVFILYKNQGPIESIASSSSYLEGNLLLQTIMFSALWSIPTIVDYVAGYFIENWYIFSVISNISFIFMAYYIYSISVGIFLTVEEKNEIESVCIDDEIVK
jgi:uncharacterized membrane protein